MGDPIYFRAGVAFQDSFFYLAQDAPRTPVTGKVQGDFTISLSKDGVGNQSTVGVTIAQVDATNNPGEYGITVAASAFIATAGKYVLRIKDTASTQFSWSWTLIVTSDGTASAAAGPAMFTPIAGNGRITDGASALLGATVIIRTSGGVLYYTGTSDSSGLWGPVNFPAANATYTIYAIRSGYQQATGTITVAAGIATGPGADIAMTAAVASTGFLASELWAYARRSAHGQTGDTADVEIKQAVTEALERVATCHEWPWYRRYGEITIRAAYSTGTLTLTNGSTTATLASGTFPSWAASGRLKVSGRTIEIASRGGNTTLILDTAWNETTASGLSYVLYQDEYELPDDLYKFGRVLPGERWGWGPTPESPELLDQLQDGALYGQSGADFFAIQGQNLKLVPYPTQDTVVRYSYYCRPATLASANDVADWYPAHIRLLRRAIDCEIALRFGGYAGGSYEQAVARFNEAKADAVPNDRTQSTEAPVLGSAFGLRAPLWRRR